MIIIKEKIIEDCLEGKNVKDILLDSEIDINFIEYLGRLGKLILKDEIEKPFFKIIVKSKYTIKGSLTNRSIRVMLPESDFENDFNDLKKYINEFK